MPIDSYQEWTYSIRCDKCGQLGPADTDQGYVEEQAEKGGWQIHRNGDDERDWYILCPKCIHREGELSSSKADAGRTR